VVLRCLIQQILDFDVDALQVDGWLATGDSRILRLDEIATAKRTSWLIQK